MGAGKSYVGRQLAQALGRSFIDLDDRIEAAARQSIARYFAEHGEEAFRKLEQQCLHATKEDEKAVIACGGGTPCFFDNMDWINTHGVSIYLDATPAVIARRLQDEMAHRPILKGLKKEELEPFVTQKLADRAPFYEQAMICYTIHSADEDVAAHLIHHFQDIVGH
jgi:shikimate kinase